MMIKCDSKSRKIGKKARPSKAFYIWGNFKGENPNESQKCQTIFYTVPNFYLSVLKYLGGRKEGRVDYICFESHL